MNVEAWVWTADQDYPGVDNNDGHLPIAGVNFKTHDGPNMMLSLADIEELKSIYDQQGIYFHSWCVPWGTDIVREAAIASVILDHTNILILDVEPLSYRDFWQAPWANLHPYMQAIRAAHPNAHIGISFDPRPEIAHNGDHVHLAEWAQHGIDSWWPQVYWTDFVRVGRGMTIGEMMALLDQTNAVMDALGGEKVWAVPGIDADAQRFRMGCEHALALGGRLSVWRRGVTTAQNWETLRAIGQPEPEPEPQPVEEWIRLADAIAALEALPRRS